VFDDEVGKTFSLNLSDLSRETWSLLPQPGDFVAEVRTRRYDDLTYARASGEPEDVSLFQRASKRNIAAYASTQKMNSRGRFYDEDDLTEYDVIDYEIDTVFQPDRDWLDGRTKMRLRVKSFALGVLTLRLAETLNVSSVTSDELGRLLFLRVSNQTGIVVNLPTPVSRDFILTLTIAYSGRIRARARSTSRWRSPPARARSARSPRTSLRARRAQVAVQQPLVLVPAGIGHRLRHEHDARHRAIGLHGGGSGMAAGAPVPVGPAGPDMPAPVAVHVRHRPAGALPGHRRQQAEPGRRRHRGPGHRLCELRA